MHCTHCHHVMHKERLPAYAYDLSGLSNVVVHNVEQFQCPSCSGKAVTFHAIEALHHALARALITKETRLTAQEVRFLREHLEMTNQAFARALGVTEHQSSRWMSGAPMNSSAEHLLRLLVASRVGLAMVKRAVAVVSQGIREGQSKLDARRHGKEWMVQVSELG